MRKCANISPYMRRPLVIYDCAPDPSEFPLIGGKFYFFFISVGWHRPKERFEKRRKDANERIRQRRKRRATERRRDRRTTVKKKHY